MKDQEYGVINEVGDLGFGFYPISESEQEQIKKEEENKKGEEE